MVQQWFATLAAISLALLPMAVEAKVNADWPVSDAGPVWLAENDGSVNNVEVVDHFIRMSRCWPSEIGLYICAVVETGSDERSAVSIRSGYVLDINRAFALRNDYSCLVEASSSESLGPRTITERILGTGHSNTITVDELEKRWSAGFVESTLDRSREVNGFHFDCLAIGELIADKGVSSFLDPFYVGVKTISGRQSPAAGVKN